MAGKRVFAAIDLSDEARARVRDYIEELSREFRHLRVGWEKPEKLHITLRFAGNIDDEHLHELTARAARAAERTRPFSILISGTGTFLKRGGSNVLWLRLTLGGGPSDVFQRLASELGTEDKGRDFRPHLTIGRLREPDNSRELIRKHLEGNFASVEFRPLGIVIYESTLLPTGSTYAVLSRHPF